MTNVDTQNFTKILKLVSKLSSNASETAATVQLYVKTVMSV